MSIFSSLFGWFFWDGSVSIDSDAETTTSLHEDCCCTINPATNLPMMGCWLDVEGNPYGVDLHHHNETWLSEDTASSTDTSTDSLFSPWDE